MEVEVRGLTDDVDTDFLILYLESKRRSGGGPVSSFTRTESQALITFQNISDAENILSQEEHCVQSVTIRVRRLPPWDLGKVALRGLHPDTDECFLQIFVENVSGREEFLLMRSSDRTTILVTFHEPLSDEEFDSLERNVEKRPVQGSSLSVQRVRLCAEVLVENLGESVSIDLLEMYFESRRSGGGRVNLVTMLRNNSAAIVSFDDVNVAARVLTRTHSLQSSRLTVSPYYPALLGSPSIEETGSPEEKNRGVPNIVKDHGIEQQTGIKTEDKMEVQDCPHQKLNLVEPCDNQARASAVGGHKEQHMDPHEAQTPEEMTQTDPPMMDARDNTRASTFLQPEEVEVLMDSSELRFLQEYHHELLAGINQVTIVPLEVQGKCGFKVTGDAVSCRTAVELLRHILSSVSYRMVTLQFPGVSLFLLEDEGQRVVLETEQQNQCIIDTSRLSWKVTGCKSADPWSFVHIPNTSTFQSFKAEELSLVADVPPQSAADLDIKVFASLLKNPQSEEDKEEIPATTTEWNIKQEEDVDLYTDASPKGQDEVSDDAEDEELHQACKMSRDEFQDRQLDEEAQLLLAIQMSMDTLDTAMEDEEKALQRALQLSLREQVLVEAEEPLQRALEMSLQNSWAYDETSPGQADFNDVSGDEVVKAWDTAEIKILAGDETSLVVACAAIRKAVSGTLCTLTLDGVDDFQYKTEILSALEKKHKVTISEYEGQTQIQGFLQNPLNSQKELSQILSALHGESRSGLMTLDWQQSVILTPVLETSEEYNSIVQQFLSTLKGQRAVTQVLQVQKVQNGLLYKQYQLKKASMAHCPKTPIERTLYHGTTENGAKEICHHGFNRSFCGKNATQYGHGVYFAVEATISARERYSTPSSSGNKYILVARVLTGEFTVGREDMKTPPIKPGTVGDVPQRYDSLVDDLQNPSIFVIFNDTQAYPKYLITCCNKRDHMK
ncbi:protein mono-ADP-ribosyltransferase PARP10 isoform X2 [Dendrobates tinctorius]|uniref:protein mono-ADP-ribosyltransferase PARP10 isoform X2 n=1 Tax=Dendrobates tinctorius TaxID=92724 RepID=UPI003CC9E28C